MVDNVSVEPDGLAGDLMRGVGAIGAFLGMTPRQTYHALSQGYLPAFKMGDVWLARKSTLVKHIAAQEARKSTSDSEAA